MKNILPKSLKGKIVFALVFTTGLLTLAVFFLVFLAAVKFGAEGQLEDYKVFTYEQTDSINQILNNSKNIAEKLSTRTEIKNYLSGGSTTKEEVTRILSNYNLGNNYYALYLLDTKGKAIASTDIRFLDQDYSYRNYYLQAIQGVPTTEVAIGATSRKLGIYFSTPVYNSDSNIIGIIVVKQNPESISKSISQNQLADPIKSYIVDGNGVVVITNDNDKLYKSFGTLTAEETIQVSDRKTYEGVYVNSIGYDEVKNEIKSANTIEPFLIASNAETLTGMKLNSGELYLVNIIERESYYHGVRLIVIVLVSLFILFLILKIIVINLVVGKYTEPINKLTEATNDIKKGDFNLKLDTDRKDELGDLARSFSKMAEKIESEQKELKKAKSELEIKVAEKTKNMKIYIKELEEINQSLLGREQKITELKEKLENCVKE